MTNDDTAPRSGIGEPTVTLAETEYRDWVQSRIAANMIRRITGVGLTALAVGFSALAVFIGIFVENAKKDVRDGLNADLQRHLSGELERKVATTIIQFPQLQKAIIDVAEETIKETTDPSILSDKIINDPGLMDKIAGEVTGKLTKVGSLNDYLVKELENSLEIQIWNRINARSPSSCW